MHNFVAFLVPLFDHAKPKYLTEQGIWELHFQASQHNWFGHTQSLLAILADYRPSPDFPFPEQDPQHSKCMGIFFPQLDKSAVGHQQRIPLANTVCPHHCQVSANFQITAKSKEAETIYLLYQYPCSLLSCRIKGDNGTVESCQSGRS